MPPETPTGGNLSPDSLERLAAELGPHLVDSMVKVAQATFDNALRRLALPLEEPGTVQTTTTDLTANVSVILDSQYSGTVQPPTAVTVQNVTGIRLTAGQRVMVWHAPNGGAYAKELISGPGPVAGPSAVGADYTFLQSLAAATNGVQWAGVGAGLNVDTSETTTSTSYTDLATVGPAVTVTTGARAIVIVGATLSNNTLGSFSLASYAVSGATTAAAADAGAISYRSPIAAYGASFSKVNYVSGLTAGSNVFTMKYKIAVASTGTFANRNIVVIPLP